MAAYLHKCINEECEKFDEIFEDRRKMSEHDKEIPCQVCEKITTKVLGQTSFTLKGTGWYRDSYQPMTPVGNLMKRTDSAK
jgi:putative FmdB family regulatory protein